MRNKQKFQIIDGCLWAADKKIFIKNVNILSVLSDEGANATVYLAQDSYLKRKVALKIWCRKDRKIEISSERAKEECAKIAKLNHSLISTIYSADIVEGYPVAVLELLEGITLREWLKINHNFFDRLRVWDQISKTLKYCHGKFVFHGDLHWENIMINDDKVKIFDFGSSLFSTHTNSIKRENQCLLRLVEKIFDDIPFGDLIIHIESPELTRQTIDSVLSIFFGIDSLKEDWTEVSDENKLYQYKSFIRHITDHMKNSPMLSFHGIEKILREFLFSDTDKEYENFVIQTFYNYLFEASIQRLNSNNKLDVPNNVDRKLAEEKYKEWRDYYMRKQ